ncbi:MAG: glycosyltransferase [Actinobacteria bacterium]|nr:glycosyltransferase [Actinomycetota bacterium]
MSPATAAEVEVEVVLSNYNYGRFLADAVASVRAQTHPRTRLIVVDDGSSDDSRAVLNRLAGEIDEVVLKANGGQASAINTGFERCRGDVVVFLDADDVLRPDVAARAAAAFAADPSLVKTQSRMEVIDGAGHRTGELKPADHLPLPNGDLRAAELASPFDQTWMAMSANAFRTEALRRIMPMPPAAFRICADWYLVHLAALLGDVASFPEPLVAYRVHGGNNYQPEEPRLDLDHIRQTIGFAEATIAELEALADRLRLPRPARIISIWALANRLISLRADPSRHPVPGDSRRRILADAVRALRRRSDVSAPLAAMFLAWFAVESVAPRRLAGPLGEAFLYSERRPALNRLLARLRP